MKKLKKWQIVLIVILALGVIGALAGRGDEEKKNRRICDSSFCLSRYLSNAD